MAAANMELSCQLFDSCHVNEQCLSLLAINLQGNFNIYLPALISNKGYNNGVANHLVATAICVKTGKDDIFQDSCRGKRLFGLVSFLW